MYSIMVEDANNRQSCSFGLKAQVPENTLIACFNLESITNIAKLHSPLIFEDFGSILLPCLYI